MFSPDGRLDSSRIPPAWTTIRPNTLRPRRCYVTIFAMGWQITLRLMNWATNTWRAGNTQLARDTRPLCQDVCRIPVYLIGRSLWRESR